MNNNAGYQPAEQTTVVVVNPSRLRGPQFMRQGVRVGGLMMGLSCIICMGMFGGFFILSATIMLATANYDDDFWDKFDRDTDPAAIVGSIFLVIGILLVAACVGLSIYARRNYKRLEGTISNPGRVINPPPGHQGQSLTAGYPGQPQSTNYPGQPHPTGYPGQPLPTGYPSQQQTGYPGQPQPAGYGQPQPFGYPGQPQPFDFPAQPPVCPAPISSYPGPPAPYPHPPGGYATQPDQPYPEKMNVINVNREYTPPPPTAPDTVSQPPPYQP